MKKLSFVLTLLLVMFFSFATFAYILPIRHLLKQLENENRNVRRLQIKQIHRIKQNGVWKSWNETLSIFRPGKIRLERTFENKIIHKELHTGTSSSIWTPQEGTKTVPRKANPFLDFFAVHPSGSGLGSIEHLLSRLNIQTKGSSLLHRKSDYYVQSNVFLTWFHSFSCIAVGGSSVRSTQNQFWFHRTKYYPVRFKGTFQNKKIDIQFFEYHSTTEGNHYPGRIEIFEEKEKTEQILVLEVKTPNSFPSNLFSSL